MRRLIMMVMKDRKTVLGTKVENQLISRPFSAATMMTTSELVLNLQGGCLAFFNIPTFVLFVPYVVDVALLMSCDIIVSPS
jgi:hypothetical protein